MDVTPLVPLHIGAGALGLMSGAAATVFTKGSRPHRLAGNVFFVSMLTMSGTGAIVAWFAPAMASVVAGLLTFYMVATGWRTAKRDGKPAGLVDIVWLLVAVAIAALGITSGLEASASDTGSLHGFPAGIYFAFGSVAAIAAVMDLRLIIRRTIAGAQRIARHLWRMLFGLYMATSSFFLGQSQLFPEPIRKTHILALPVIAVVLALLFWLVRVLFTKWYRDTAVDSGVTPAS